MKGLHKLILTHFETHQRAKWDDPKARDMLAKLLVKKIEAEWMTSTALSRRDGGEPTTADKYNKEYVANQYGDDDYPTNLLDDESV